jgi:hypothetical protein
MALSAYSQTLLFANNASTTVAGAISSSATSVNLASGSGALFPSPSAGQAFVGSFFDAATGLITEIVLATARSTDTLTIVRAQENTTAQAWNPGDIFINEWTAGSATSMQQTAVLTPARVITLSGAFTLLSTDGAVGLNRTTSLSASSTTLYATPGNGQVTNIEDLVGNFNGYPVTVSANAGQTIDGLASVVLNVNRQSASFRYYTSGAIWSFKT